MKVCNDRDELEIDKNIFKFRSFILMKIIYSLLYFFINKNKGDGSLFDSFIVMI